MGNPGSAILVGLACAGCGTVGPGRLDGTTMREAATIPAQELEIRVDERGEVQKLAMEHGDASRIPAAVMKLVQEKLPGASPERYELELRPGTPATYEVEVKTKGGQHCEVAGLADGTFKYLECELPAAELPATITDWIKANHPGAAISEVETVKGPGVDEIAVEIKVGEALFALHFKASGELLRRCLVVPATIELPRP